MQWAEPYSIFHGDVSCNRSQHGSHFDLGAVDSAACPVLPLIIGPSTTALTASQQTSIYLIRVDIRNRGFGFGKVRVGFGYLVVLYTSIFCSACKYFRTWLQNSDYDSRCWNYQVIQVTRSIEWNVKSVLESKQQMHCLCLRSTNLSLFQALWCLHRECLWLFVICL